MSHSISERASDFILLIYEHIFYQAVRLQLCTLLFLSCHLTLFETVSICLGLTGDTQQCVSVLR